MAINHKEAKELAEIKQQDSNLARAYLDALDKCALAHDKCLDGHCREARGILFSLVIGSERGEL